MFFTRYRLYFVADNFNENQYLKIEAIQNIELDRIPVFSSPSLPLAYFMRAETNSETRRSSK